jgi:TPP-dependent pyruvate/acetoin dehydrogenase alpha subunit
MAKTLNSKTEPAAKPPQASEEGFSLISNAKLIAIYTAMLKCRLLEQRAGSLFQHAQLKSALNAFPSREASAAAVVDLLPEDTLSIAPGDWLPAFVKGLSLQSIFRVLAPGESQPDGAVAVELQQKNILGPSNETDQPGLVRELASRALIQKKGAVVMVFISAGSEPRKQWQKTIAAAAAEKLPIVFVQYMDHSLQPARSNTKSKSAPPEALFHGIPAIIVDAVDPVAVYRVAFEAITRARQARGATLLECTAHPGLPPDSTTARGPAPGIEFPSPDPVISMERYLKSKKIDSEPHSRYIVESFSRDLDLATRFLDR